MKSLPKRIFLEGLVYKILQTEAPNVRGMEAGGTIDHESCIIEIKKSMSLNSKWDTLFHEVVHKAAPFLSEKDVENLATRLFSILITNNLLNIGR